MPNLAMRCWHLYSQPLPTILPPHTTQGQGQATDSCRNSPLASFQIHAGCVEGLEQGQVTGGIPNSGGKTQFKSCLAMATPLALTQCPPYSTTAACSHLLNNCLPGTQVTVQHLCCSEALGPSLAHAAPLPANWRVPPHHTSVHFLLPTPLG